MCTEIYRLYEFNHELPNATYSVKNLPKSEDEGSSFGGIERINEEDYN